MAPDQDPPEFVCPTCGAKSWNPNDKREGWCGRCNAQTVPSAVPVTSRKLVFSVTVEVDPANIGPVAREIREWARKWKGSVAIDSARPQPVTSIITERHDGLWHGACPTCREPIALQESGNGGALAYNPADAVATGPPEWFALKPPELENPPPGSTGHDPSKPWLPDPRRYVTAQELRRRRASGEDLGVAPPALTGIDPFERRTTFTPLPSHMLDAARIRSVPVGPSFQEIAASVRPHVRLTFPPEKVTEASKAIHGSGGLVGKCPDCREFVMLLDGRFMNHGEAQAACGGTGTVATDFLPLSEVPFGYCGTCRNKFSLMSDGTLCTHLRDSGELPSDGAYMLIDCEGSRTLPERGQ
jgi:hypothetical protein